MVKKLLPFSLLLLAFNSYSNVGFNQSRVFITDKSSKQDFLLFNRGTATEKCDIKLIDYDISEDGKLQSLGYGEYSENSAQRYIRVSPRRVEIEPQKTQKLKIIARGFSKATINELHSYLSIECIGNSIQAKRPDNSNSNLNAVGLIPKMINRIPIIIRKDQSDVNVDFTNVELANIDGEHVSLKFNLNRRGDRSIYGSIKVEDALGNQLMVRNGISSYIQTNSSTFELVVKKTLSPTLTLSFSEDPKFGGTESVSLVLDNLIKG